MFINLSGQSLPAVTLENVSRAVSNGVMHSQLSTLSDQGNVKLIVESYINAKAHWKDHISFRVVTRDGGYPKLQLLDDVTTWLPGTIKPLFTL